MAHNSSPRLDSLLSRDSGSRLKVADGQIDAKHSLTEWARTLSLHGDKALSADLALDLVLHDLVERITQATHATGGAIAIQQGGEFVCRATAGETAPGLGTRINQKSGLSALCIQSKTWQLCEDTRDDARIDAAVIAELGVRSILVFPVLRDGLMGVIEIFSAEGKAFSERDVDILRKFSAEIVGSIDEAGAIQLNPTRATETQASSTSESDAIGEAETLPRSGDTWTTVLTYVVVALALVLGFIVGRTGWRAVTTKFLRGTRNAGAAPSSPGSQSVVADSAVSSVAQPVNGVSPEAGGDLVVYQNGKRVYPPSAATDSPKRVTNNATRLSPDIAGEYVIERFEPAYPEQARSQGIQGPVVLNIRVGSDGLVKDVGVASGNSQLAVAAVDAVQRWRFQVFLRNGQPQEFSTQVTIDFRLPK